jgi:Zn-dependent protease
MSSPDADPFVYPTFGDATAHPPAPPVIPDAMFGTPTAPPPPIAPWDARPDIPVIPTQPLPWSTVDSTPAPWSPPEPQVTSYRPPSEPVVPTQRTVPPAQPGRRHRFSRGTATGAAAGAGLLGKVLLSTKALALVVLHFPTLASMIVSVAAYAYFWGWNFAVGFVLLMFAHEMGHVVVLRRQGIPASAPMFIPFLGAFVRMKGAPRSVADEAVSALAGPAVGVVTSGAVLLVGESYHLPLLIALAYTGCLLNLFNLLPMLPLDGGRVAGALHPAVWFVGLAAVLGLAILHPSIVYLLVIAIGGAELFRRWRSHTAGTDRAYMSIATATRWKIGIGYLLVLVACLAGMAATYTAARP